MKYFENGDKPTASQWDGVFTMIEEIVYSNPYNITTIPRFSTGEVVTYEKLLDMFKLLVPQIPQTRFAEYMLNFRNGSKPDYIDFDAIFAFCKNTSNLANIWINNPGYIVTPIQCQSHAVMHLKPVQFDNYIATNSNVLNEWSSLIINNMTEVSAIIAGLCVDMSEAIWYPCSTKSFSAGEIIGLNLYDSNTLNINFVHENEILVVGVQKLFDVGSGGGSVQQDGSFIVIQTSGSATNYSVYNLLITSFGYLNQQAIQLATYPIVRSISGSGFADTQFNMF